MGDVIGWACLVFSIALIAIAERHWFVLVRVLRGSHRRVLRSGYQPIKSKDSMRCPEPAPPPPPSGSPTYRTNPTCPTCGQAVRP